MNKFEYALNVFNTNYHKFTELREPTAQTMREALTQAAEIERGDKVVVDRRDADMQADLMASVSSELWSEVLHRHYTDEEIKAEAAPIKKIIDDLLAASGVRDE